MDRRGTGLWYLLSPGGMVGRVDSGGEEVWRWIKAPRHNCGAYFSECRSESMRRAPAFDDGRKGNVGIQSDWKPRVWGFFGQLIAEALEGSGFLYVDVTRLAPVPTMHLYCQISQPPEESEAQSPREQQSVCLTAVEALGPQKPLDRLWGSQI